MYLNTSTIILKPISGTRSMLCAPVLDDRGRVIAVIQALNKAPHRDGGGVFGMGGGGKDGEPVRVFVF